MVKKGSNKGQITIFIIVAIILVALLLFLFNTKIRNVIAPSKASPTMQLQDCIKNDLKEVISEVASKGGSLNPANYYMFESRKIEYLCYTNQYYQTCVMQQPLLKEHFERETLNAVKSKLESCIQKIKNSFSDKGYNVAGGEKTSIEISQDKISLIVSGITISKENSGEKYDKLTLNYNSKIYSLLMISLSILNWEARFGDSEITTYMLYYPSIRVEKLKQSDGSKIYKLADTTTKEEFVFATRSLSWPAGYNLNEIYTPIRK